MTEDKKEEIPIEKLKEIQLPNITSTIKVDISIDNLIDDMLKTKTNDEIKAIGKKLIKRAKNKAYAEKNKDKLKKYYKRNLKICECGEEVREYSLERHLTSKKHKLCMKNVEKIKTLTEAFKKDRNKYDKDLDPFRSEII